MKKIALLLCIMVLAAACDTMYRKMPSNYELAQAPAPAAITADESGKAADKTPSKPEEAQPAHRKTKLIKNASVNFQVKDYKKSKAAIETIVENYNGYIASEKESNTAWRIQNAMVIRVKYDNFSKLLNELLKESYYLNNKDINVEDVTEKFVDMETRLKTKKQIELRYLELLQQAKNVKDMLEVERELRMLREEIEATEGKLKYLEDQVLFSTISLLFYQELDYAGEPKPGFFKEVFKAIKGGWESLRYFLIGIFYIWPYIIIIFLIYCAIRMHRRKKKKIST